MLDNTNKIVEMLREQIPAAWDDTIQEFVLELNAFLTEHPNCVITDWEVVYRSARLAISFDTQPEYWAEVDMIVCRLESRVSKHCPVCGEYIIHPRNDAIFCPHCNFRYNF